MQHEHDSSVIKLALLMCPRGTQAVTKLKFTLKPDTSSTCRRFEAQRIVEAAWS